MLRTSSRITGQILGSCDDDPNKKKVSQLDVSSGLDTDVLGVVFGDALHPGIMITVTSRNSHGDYCGMPMTWLLFNFLAALFPGAWSIYIL